MALPDRPVSHASIESVWGQAVHDYTFAPSGCRAHGTQSTISDVSDQALDLSVADDDPGGYVDTANDRILVPTGGEGLYLINCEFGAVTGAVDSETRGTIYLNGAKLSSALEQNEAGVAVAWSVTTMVELTAGDVLTFTARLRHDSGANPSVNVASFQMARIGAEFGA